MIGFDVETLRRRLLALGYLFAAEEDEAAGELERSALDLALLRAWDFAEQFCNRLPNWETAEEIPAGLRSAVLDLASAYFLQSRLALAPDSLAVMPGLTSLRLGDAAWGFGGGSQRSGVDEKSRAESLTADLLASARAALCGWRSVY